jgi:hypothetical protein
LLHRLDQDFGWDVELAVELVNYIEGDRTGAAHDATEWFERDAKPCPWLDGRGGRPHFPFTVFFIISVAYFRPSTV